MKSCEEAGLSAVDWGFVSNLVDDHDVAPVLRSSEHLFSA
jgi:hypothetical protein